MAGTKPLKGDGWMYAVRRRITYEVVEVETDGDLTHAKQAVKREALDRAKRGGRVVEEGASFASIVDGDNGLHVDRELADWACAAAIRTEKARRTVMVEHHG